MGDFGPTSATTNAAFESFSTDIFKDNKIQELNESKDSDEGFSSSFSPTSEASMIQTETSMHLWGNNGEKEEAYFLSSLTPVNSVNTTSFSSQNTRRMVQAAPSPIQHGKKPSPNLSTYLASNKAAAHSLGVSNSGWNQQPPTQTSSWPSNPPNPIGSNTLSSGNWNAAGMRNPNGMSNGMSNTMHLNNAQQIALQIQQQKQMLTKTNGLLPHGHGHVNGHHHHHHSVNHPFPQHIINQTAAIQQKNMKNRGMNGVMPFNITTGSNVVQSSGIDSTMVDDISHLTNSFSNLSAANDHGNNHNSVNGFMNNQVSFVIFILLGRPSRFFCFFKKNILP